MDSVEVTLGLHVSRLLTHRQLTKIQVSFVQCAHLQRELLFADQPCTYRRDTSHRVVLDPRSLSPPPQLRERADDGNDA